MTKTYIAWFLWTVRMTAHNSAVYEWTSSLKQVFYNEQTHRSGIAKNHESKPDKHEAVTWIYVNILAYTLPIVCQLVLYVWMQHSWTFRIAKSIRVSLVHMHFGKKKKDIAVQLQLKINSIKQTRLNMSFINIIGLYR